MRRRTKVYVAMQPDMFVDGTGEPVNYTPPSTASSIVSEGDALFQWKALSVMQRSGSLKRMNSDGSLKRMNSDESQELEPLKENMSEEERVVI